MGNLLTTIQRIAVNAVNATNPVTFYIGTVTSVSPLKVRIHNTTLEVDQDCLLLSSSVVEKKITINSHNHPIGSALTNHTHPYTDTTPGGPTVAMTQASTDLASAKVDAITLEGSCVEHGETLNVEQKDGNLVITYNRALKKDDKLLMMKVSNGQQFVILSRVFEHKES